MRASDLLRPWRVKELEGSVLETGEVALSSEEA
jgi:hypothetical protein